MANGLASGRSSFYDLVHPTHSREATEQAHAAIGSSGSSSSNTVPPGAVPAAAAAAGGGVVTQPMAITGVSDYHKCAPGGFTQQCILATGLAAGLHSL